jgi:LysM repeat protein
MKQLLLLLFLAPISLLAQKTHKVGPGETMYSIGRKYTVSPKDLAAYNDLPPETAVKIGQVLKIPASSSATTPATTSTTRPQTAASNPVNTTESSSPIFHKVVKGETLFQISSKYSNASVDKIKKWNKLSGDGVNEGANLIVGYKSSSVPTVAVKETTPPNNNVSPPNTSNTLNKSTSTTVNNTNNETPATSIKTNMNAAAGGGFFKKSFVKIEGIVSESGTVGVFKSTSGWDDGKYYCLFNKAPSGTIVKIINPENQKFIFAKVLDVMPDIRQNKDLLISISSSAADQLGIKDGMKTGNFNAEISY